MAKARGQTQIRIRPDGRLYVEGVGEDLLEMVAALCPRDASVRKRLEVLRQTRGGRQSPHADQEQRHGDAEAGQ